MSQITKTDYLHVVTKTTAFSVVVLVSLILIFLFIESRQSLNEVGIQRFVSSEAWLPDPSAQDGQFGLREIIAGSFVCTSLALLISIPLGIACSVGIALYAPNRIAKSMELLIQLLAGIPSVVLGLWGLTRVAPILQNISLTGLNLLTASLVLALMVLPTIVIASLHALKQSAHELEETIASLGIEKDTAVASLILPHAFPAIGLGILLATARAIGETMVVVMLCGNVIQYPSSLVSPMRTITGTIALEMAYAYGNHRSALFFAGALLMLMVASLLVIRESIRR